MILTISSADNYLPVSSNSILLLICLSCGKVSVSSVYFYKFTNNLFY